MATYSPAQAAEVSGFSIDTLRYYEREGILRPIARTPGGHRTYTEDDLGWLDLVHCLRDTGMPIADLKRYAELSIDQATLAARVALLEEHDRRVQESIDALRGQQEKLREKIACYRKQGAGHTPRISPDRSGTGATQRNAPPEYSTIKSL